MHAAHGKDAYFPMSWCRSTCVLVLMASLLSPAAHPPHTRLLHCLLACMVTVHTHLHAVMVEVGDTVEVVRAGDLEPGRPATDQVLEQQAATPPPTTGEAGCINLHHHVIASVCATTGCCCNLHHHAGVRLMHMMMEVDAQHSGAEQHLVSVCGGVWLNGYSTTSTAHHTQKPNVARHYTLIAQCAEASWCCAGCAFLHL